MPLYGFSGIPTITTDRIADNAITTSKIADNAITLDKIADKSTTPAANKIPVTDSKGYLPIGWITTKNALTIYVDNVNGSDTTGDGSSANPFATVSKALSTLPIRLTHNVVIVLKASPVSYGSIYVRGFIGSGGSLTIQGEFTRLESGTVSSFSNSVDDPVYGNLVQVAKITDTTKSWTTNQFQYKLIRIYKGSTSYFRTICYNDENSIYCNQTFPVAIDNTWNYEILDWATVVDYIQTDYNQLLLNIRNLKIQRNINNYVFVPRRTTAITVDNVFIQGYPNASFPTVYSYETTLTINSSIIDANNTTNYAIHCGDLNLPLALNLNGCIVLNNSVVSIYCNNTWTKMIIAHGTRFYKGANNPAHGINLLAGLVYFASAYGKVLVDIGSTAGLRIVRNSFATGTGNYVIGPNAGKKFVISKGVIDDGLLNVSNKLGINTADSNPDNIHSRFLCYGSFATRVHTVNSDITLGIDHHIVLVDASSGNKTITLPDASTCSGRQYIIKKIDSSSNSVVITPQSGQTIDGQASISINMQYAIVRVVSNGSNWFII